MKIWPRKLRGCATTLLIPLHCQQGECLIFRNLVLCSLCHHHRFPGVSQSTAWHFSFHMPFACHVCQGRMKPLFGAGRTRSARKGASVEPVVGKMCCSPPEWAHLHFLVLFPPPLGNFSSTISSSLFMQVQLLGAVCTDSPQPWQNTLGSWNDTGLGIVTV